MKHSFWILCATLALATASACTSASSSVSPAATAPAAAAVGPSGESLKIAAPSPTSPIGGIQLQTSTVVLSWSAPSGTYATITPSYELELRDAGGALVANPTVSATSYTVTANLALDTTHTWRVRATYQGANGPWSSTVSFKTQVAAFISGNTVYDPLSTGITVGSRNGATTFVAGQGLRLDTQLSYVQYNLPTTLSEGQFSVLIKGADEGGAGDKSKVFAMKQGTDGGDITDNNYRFTAELRGNQYSAPGSISCRIITGDATNTGRIFDCPREQKVFDSSRWYFWKFSWRTGTAQLTVRLDNETGPVVYDVVLGTGSRAYTPTPHAVFLGAPVGRAGSQDATIGGGPIYKNLFVGPTARPSFPALVGGLFPGGN